MTARLIGRAFLFLWRGVGGRKRIGTGTFTPHPSPLPQGERESGVSYGGDQVTGWERAGGRGRDHRRAVRGVDREAVGAGGDRRAGGREARRSVVPTARVARGADRYRS